MNTDVARTKVDAPDHWDVLCQFLPQGWEQAAKTCGALQRARGIDQPSTLLRCLLVHLAAGCSLKETAVRARQAGWCSVSHVALFKRLRASEEWLRWLAERSRRSGAGAAMPAGYRVRAVDATTIQETGATGTDWRVHYSINLDNLQCDFFELTDAKGGETLVRLPVQAGDLVMGDRAYGNARGVAHVASRGAEVLVRINLGSLPLYEKSGQRLNILQQLRTLRVGRPGQWRCHVQFDDQPYPGRLIAVRRGAQAAKAARAKLRRKARKKQKTVKDQTVEAAGFIFIWTSVSDASLTAAQALELYRVRWQIEIAFKRMKSIMGLGQLPRKSDPSARAWIHGKLLVAMLIDRLLEEADTFSPWGYRLAIAP